MPPNHRQPAKLRSDADAREALLDSGQIVDPTTSQNYRQVITTDIVDYGDLLAGPQAGLKQ